MINVTEIKIVIPSRFSSSRLQGKPLLLINDKPMFWHVVQRCLEAGFSIDDIVLATDDERISSKAIELNIPVVLTSMNHKSGTDRINEVSTILDWSDPTIVINVQGDEPLIPSKLITTVADFAKNNAEYSISTAVTAIINSEDFNNPNVVKAILGAHGRALYFTRSSSPLNRDQPDCLDLAFRHIGIYAYRVSALREFCSYAEAPLEEYEKLEQLRALSNGMTIGATVYDSMIPHGIDTQRDYDVIKELMEDNKWQI